MNIKHISQCKDVESKSFADLKLKLKLNLQNNLSTQRHSTLKKLKKKDNTIKGQSKTSNPTKYIAINFDDLNFETQ